MSAIDVICSAMSSLAAGRFPNFAFFDIFVFLWLFLCLTFWLDQPAKKIFGKTFFKLSIIVTMSLYFTVGSAVTLAS